MKRSIGIIGGSGYIGAELLRMLAAHPGFELVFASANTDCGMPIAQAQPHIAGLYPGLKFTALQESFSRIKECDLIFLAVPHGESMKVMPDLIAVPHIIDLGSDFRLKQADLYREWYGFEHTLSAQLHNWQYGLPELFREKLKAAKRIANPGCYATAVTLSMAPLLSAGLVQGTIVADCLSGTSGAGKGLKSELHFSNAHENAYAYKVGSHQHTPEIEQSLSTVAESQVTLSLTPHVVPMVRGIHATVSAEVDNGVTAAEIEGCFKEFYAGEPFVSLEPAPPSTKIVRGSNMALIYARLDHRVRRVIVTCVIDNLVKGAAGQALQNANLALGFDETLGIPRAGFYP